VEIDERIRTQVGLGKHGTEEAPADAADAAEVDLDAPISLDD
jgi:hypothetical protein